LNRQSIEERLKQQYTSKQQRVEAEHSSFSLLTTATIAAASKATPTLSHHPLIPIQEYFSVVFEFDLLTQLIQLCPPLNRDRSREDSTSFKLEQLKHNLAPKIKSFISFCLNHTTRPLLDLVPYQQLIWMLEPSSSPIELEQQKYQTAHYQSMEGKNEAMKKTPNPHMHIDGIFNHLLHFNFCYYYYY
jgi:hypothetical protein